MSSMYSQYYLHPQTTVSVMHELYPVNMSFLTCAGNVNQPVALQLQPQTNGTSQPELQREEQMYKTIRRGRVGRIAAPLKKDENEWQATKAVMG